MDCKWIWEPTHEWISQTNVHRFMRRLGFTTVRDFLHYSREHPEEFWDEMVRETGIEWSHPFGRILDKSTGVEWSRWFIDGKLNIVWNCVDRHAHGAAAENPAILWEGESGDVRSLSFAELASQVNQLAHGLDGLGLTKGDRVALCMPTVPEVVVALYACLKLGLIAVPVFAGFGAGAIATRLNDSGARVLITADQLERRGKVLPLKDKIDQALAHVSSVEHVIVWRYKSEPTKWQAGRDLHWKDMLQSSKELPALEMDSEDRALILYTSGTTGKPKGAVHTHAGVLAQTTKEIYLGFDHRSGDRFFWLSDMGWMMGPWAVIGNHHFGGTVFLYDGAPDYPATDRLWRIIEQHRISTFGLSPTVIRMLKRSGAESPQRHDLSSLRLLGSTGEPWDETSWMWFFEEVGARRLPIINISGGTEIIGCFLLPLPTQPQKPCTLGGPAPGMSTEIFDEAGHPVRGHTGYLVCTKPAPSMTRGIWGDPQRYIETYWSRWPGVWNHGDWASVDADGCWFLHGRADESMNVAGRKVGPAEIEQALMEHPLIAEAVVVGVPDEIKGEAIVAFVVASTGAALTESVLQEVAERVVENLGPTLRPSSIHVVKELPKTQSGKVMRRLIRQTYLGQAPGDLSSVADPTALKAFATLD